MRQTRFARSRGCDRVGLVGWTVPPDYNPARHELIWAKDLLFSSADGEHTLNDDMRLLGRHGVPTVNFIGRMVDLDLIGEAGPEVLAMASFNDGSAYADYQSGARSPAMALQV